MVAAWFMFAGRGSDAQPLAAMAAGMVRPCACLAAKCPAGAFCTTLARAPPPSLPPACLLHLSAASRAACPCHPPTTLLLRTAGAFCAAFLCDAADVGVHTLVVGALMHQHFGVGLPVGHDVLALVEGAGIAVAVVSTVAATLGELLAARRAAEGAAAAAHDRLLHEVQAARLRHGVPEAAGQLSEQQGRGSGEGGEQLRGL